MLSFPYLSPYLGCCCSVLSPVLHHLSCDSLPVSVSSESLCLLTSMCTFAATSVHCVNLHWKTNFSFEALQASACLASYTPEEPVNLRTADNLRKTPKFHRALDMALPPQRLCSSMHSPFIAFFKSYIWFADTHLQNENNELGFPEMELNPGPVLEKSVVRERIATTSGLLVRVTPAVQGLEPLRFTVLLCY